MKDLLLALRNVGRNRRRSAVTILGVALSCGGLGLFGGYVVWSFHAVEEQTIACFGHLQIYKKGYYDEGSGDPSSYALSNYEQIRQMLVTDEIIGPRLEMVTAQIVVTGIVNCAATGASTTFYGVGVFPADDDRLWRWNPYGICPASSLAINTALHEGPAELAEDDANGGSVGPGLARILKLGREPPPAKKTTAPAAAEGSDQEVDLSFLTEQATAKSEPASTRPQLDLLVSPPGGGLPNVTTLGLRKIIPRATKELDDALIKLPIQQASELLFPGQPLHATAVIALLKRTEDTEIVVQRLQELIAQNHLDLEWKRWLEIRPMYSQVKRFMSIIFGFVFILLAVLVAFAIYNTQSASIVERLGEIGTLRAMGLTRFGVWKILALEGFCLGLIGGLIGVAISIGGDLFLRSVNILYIPPGVSFYNKVEVLVLRQPWIMLIAFGGSLLCAIISSALPARRAARTPIVEALRHV